MHNDTERDPCTWPSLDELKFTRLEQHAPRKELEQAFLKVTDDLDTTWLQALDRILKRQEQLDQHNASLAALLASAQQRTSKAIVAARMDVPAEMHEQVTGCYGTIQRIQVLCHAIDAQLPPAYKMEQYGKLHERMKQPFASIQHAPDASGKRPLRSRQSSGQLRAPRLRTLAPVPALPGHALPVAERDSVSIRTSIVSRSVFSIRRFFGRSAPATAETQLRRVSEQL
jgi:hypothetical protein